MIKQLYDMGLSNIVYYVFQGLGIMAAFLYGIQYRKKYGLSVRKTVILLSVIFVAVYIWTFAHFLIETGFTGIGTTSIYRALPYLLLIAWPVSALVKVKWETICDFMAPLMSLSVGISLFGCAFAGCCEGYPSTWGIYNVRYGGFAFPVQIFEAMTLLIIFVFLLWRNKQHKYNSNGKSYPIMLMLFGSTRFLWEFARNTEKIWIGCSALSFHALFMLIVGLDAFFTIQEKEKQKGKKIERFIRNPKKIRSRRK